MTKVTDATVITFLVFAVINYFSTAFVSKLAHIPSIKKFNILMQTEIVPAYNNDIPRVANFLGQYWYNIDISKSQRLEFIRLEKNDLLKRYGEQVGQRKYPAVLLMALEDEEILGYNYKPYI